MFGVSQRKLPGILSLGAYYVIFKMLWGVMRPAINDIVRPQLGLPGYPWYGPYFRDLHTAKVINGFSEHVLPRPADWPDNCQVTGYWFLDQPHWTPPESLSRFLASGPKPVYIGFGSMVSSSARAFTQTVLDAVKTSGRRAVLATGWGALDGEDGPQNDQIFFLRHAPHDGLFPLMSAAVHHGGAGTTAAAVRAGIPSVVVPFFGDQPFWAHRLNRIGVAPPAVDRRTLTADALASALSATQEPAMIQAASALGRTVRAEDGIREALRRLRKWKLLPATVPDGPDKQVIRSAR
jgi:UDP:flavonoid glycosyltransferase YjiC (YdhE family)